MNKISLALASAATLALGAGAAAYAKASDRPAPGADMTRAEVEAHTAEAFARMDANHDGVLDKTDREAHRAERQDARFEQLDTDNNGSISRAEFDAAGDRLRERFGGRGDDGEGFGRRGPGKRGFGGLRGPGGPRAMLGADADGDKAISAAEFSAAALERFDRADADHDGTVTAEERRAAMKAFRDRRRAQREDVPS